MNFKNHIQKKIPINDIHFTSTFPDDETILKFLLTSVPLACQDVSVAERLQFIGNIYKLSDEQKREKIKYIKDNMSTIRDFLNTFIESDDNELIEWFSTTSRYVSLFTRPYIPK
jgi:hypothetical protein